MVTRKTKRVLILGLREVGRAIYSIVRSAGYRVYGYDPDPSRSINRFEEIKTPVDVMHVCYPYSSSFIETTVDYVKMFKLSLVLIESTISPGTTDETYSKTGVDVTHSPIRDKHPNLEKHIRFWVKWIGPTTPSAAEKAEEHYESLGLRVRITSSSRSLYTSLGMVVL